MGIGGRFVVDTNIIFILRKAIQTNGTDFIERFDLILSRLIIVQIPIGLPSALAMIDFDVNAGLVTTNCNGRLRT